MVKLARHVRVARGRVGWVVGVEPELTSTGLVKSEDIWRNAVNHLVQSSGLTAYLYPDSLAVDRDISPKLRNLSNCVRGPR